MNLTSDGCSFMRLQYWWTACAEPSVQARCAWFSSCLCKVWSRVSEVLLLALRTFVALFRHYLLQTVKLLYISLRSQQQYTVLSFVSMRRHGHSHKLTLFTCTMVLHCGHTFLRRIRWSNLRYCTVDIPFWTSRKRSHKRLHVSSTEKPQCHVLQLTWSHIYCYVRVTERYMETLHMKKMAALHSCRLTVSFNFWTKQFLEKKAF